MFVYRCIAERQTCPEIGLYESFGLEVCVFLRGQWQTLTMLSDISLDRTLVEQLAAQCTELQLDPVHLMDVVEDALA